MPPARCLLTPDIFSVYGTELVCWPGPSNECVHDPKISNMNRPLPSSKNPHFQNEAKCTTFLVKVSFICMRMKTHFRFKG